MANPIFLTAMSSALEAQLATFSVTVNLNGNPISAIPNDETGKATLVKGGLEMQESIEITVRKSEYDSIIAQYPRRQNLVEVEGMELMINSVKRKPSMPFVVLDCTRYR